MRGLFNALALLKVFVSAAPFVPDDQVDQEWDRRGVTTLTEARALAHIEVDVPSKSPDVVPTTLGFRIEVLNSETTCGFGNVTIDGIVLPQTGDGDVSTGKGSVSTNTKGVVVGSWNFHCIRVNGIPDAQLLKFTVNYVDGRAMEDSGFSMLFRQSGMPEIMTIEADLSISDEIIANPNPKGLKPDHGNSHKYHGAIKDVFAELDYLWSQLEEIRYLFHQKERSIALYANRRYETDIKDCDSLKCVVKAMAHQAKHAAFGIYGKISGDDEEPRHGRHHPDESFERFRGHKGGNHGNHTHPLPPWKRPHSRPLPICRYPPPPPYGHQRPSHHGPPAPPPPPPHHAPDMPPPEFAGPPPHHHMPPPPPHHGSPTGHDDDHEGPPPPSALYEPGPPPPGSPPHHCRPSHNVGRALQIIMFTSIGFLFAFLLAALHRRVCTPSPRADRHERRRLRPERKRAAHKHIITILLARMAGNDSDDEDNDEKREALLEDAEDGVSATTSEDISQLRNAADAVGDMVELVAVNTEGRTQAPPMPTPAPVSQPMSIPVSSTMPLMQDFEEQLPAYEDDEGTEMDSIISDGYRPGMLYTPSQSSDGSLSDILGPDTKS
ncbi:hypothetical protein BJ878DRAFT_229133 [Calycina marina]|uniref:Uncharacterized protein n=1 Tax=Calycina marina TaxID=1763456 RepID=A0A9P7YXX3_9HELO|nr:hypothetical protein BJ878DRAFT_229133 [Calycina marina]